MAAAQVAGTPAPAPVEAPTSPLSEGSDAIGLHDALAQLEAPADGEEPAAGEPEATPAEPAPTKPETAPAAPSDPFSAEALAAPGGIEKAQAVLREKQREHDKAFLKVRDREQRLKHDTERWKGELGQARAFLQSVQADMALLADGNAEQKLEALGRLSRGKDPLKVWEEISVTAASGGRKAPSPEVLELKQELANLRAELEQKQTREQEAAAERQAKAQVGQLHNQMLQGASDAAKYPVLAHFAKTHPEGTIQELDRRIVAAYNPKAGTGITWEQAFAELNAELAQEASAVQAAQGLATLTAQQAAKPVVPTQRSPGRSLNPSLETRPNAQVREM